MALVKVVKEERRVLSTFSQSSPILGREILVCVEIDLIGRRLCHFKGRALS